MAPARDNSWADVTALVLCGGFGTRLSSVVADRPKALADVGGRPFLGLLLDRLAAAGIPRAILCVGHMAASIRSACSAMHGGMAVEFSEEDRPLGTAGALRLALPLVRTRDVLVLNGDSWCDVDLRVFRAAYEARGRDPMIVLVEVPDASRFGSVDYDPAGFIRGFQEKSTAGGPGLINAGVYLLPAESLRGIPPGIAVSLERDVFPTWVSAGLRGHRCAGPFLDIGTPESYARAADFFGRGWPGRATHAGP